jgi:hypothetical protein
VNLPTSRRRGAALLAALSLVILGSQEARADDELTLDWSGKIQSDLRFRLQTVGIGAWYNRQELPAGVERNWNTANLRLDAKYGRFSAVADMYFVWSDYPERMTSMGDLSRIEKADPYRLETRGAYIEAKDLFVHGLDLRIGEQIVQWGVGDQFNPTNNINPDDLRDPLLFGRQAANFMVKADYWINEDWSITGVLVPIFKPALLPLSAGLGVAAVDRLPFTNAKIRQRVEAENAASATSLVNNPVAIGTITPSLPAPTFDNMQFAYRLAGTIGEQDVSLSYYLGRTDFPQPIANHVHQEAGKRCNPSNSSQCVDGLLRTDVTLAYPRMHVYGFNMTGEFNPFKWLSEDINGIGYRLEGALIVPTRQTIGLTQDALNLAFPQPAGEYDYDGDGKPGGPRPAVVDATPFLKWTLGLDYQFGEHVYVNAQWVHGLADEFGAGDWIHPGYTVRQSGVTSSDTDTVFRCALKKDGTLCAHEILRPRLGDYVVLGADFKFMNQAGTFRLFTIFDATGLVEESWDDEQGKRVQKKLSPFSPEGFSMVIFPELDYNFGNGLELSAGALFELGKSYTKFGDPAAGGSLLWTRGRFSF